MNRGLALLLLVGCAGPSFSEEERVLLATLSPEVLPAPPPDVSNAFADNPQAAAFGQRLFFSTAFSGELLDGDNDGSEFATGHRGDTGTVACASCHVAASGFSDTRTLHRQVSLGAGWGLRRAPSLLDVGQSRLLTWSGRRDTNYGQIFGPIESEVEMNSSRLYVAEQAYLLFRQQYELLFGAMPPLADSARFPPLSAIETGCRQLDSTSHCVARVRGVPGDAASFDAMTEVDQQAVERVVVNLGKAIGAFERRLSCGPSRFDAWMHGDEAAMSQDEIEGARLFVGRGQCIDCHSGPFFSDERFHNIGLRPEVVAAVFIDSGDRGAAQGLAERALDPVRVESVFSDGDDGRAEIAITDTLEGAFRTPRLRCVAERPSFMHTGQLRTLEEVVAFHSRGGDPAGYPGQNELTRLDLDPTERAELAAFLRALSGPGPSAELLQSP